MFYNLRLVAIGSVGAPMIHPDRFVSGSKSCPHYVNNNKNDPDLKPEPY